MCSPIVGEDLEVPIGSVWRAPASCAYTFILSASSRVQNGYGKIFPYTDYHISLTVLKGVGAGYVHGCEDFSFGLVTPIEIGEIPVIDPVLAKDLELKPIMKMENLPAVKSMTIISRM